MQIPSARYGNARILSDNILWMNVELKLSGWRYRFGTWFATRISIESDNAHCVSDYKKRQNYGLPKEIPRCMPRLICLTVLMFFFCCNVIVTAFFFLIKCLLPGTVTEPCIPIVWADQAILLSEYVEYQIKLAVLFVSEYYTYYNDIILYNAIRNNRIRLDTYQLNQSH